MHENSNIESPDGTSMLYFPFSSVTAPVEVPSIRTPAPITGSPEASTTVPEITFTGRVLEVSLGVRVFSVRVICLSGLTSYFIPSPFSSSSITDSMLEPVALTLTTASWLGSILL